MRVWLMILGVWVLWGGMTACAFMPSGPTMLELPGLPPWLRDPIPPLVWSVRVSWSDETQWMGAGDALQRCTLPPGSDTPGLAWVLAELWSPGGQAWSRLGHVWPAGTAPRDRAGTLNPTIPGGMAAWLARSRGDVGRPTPNWARLQEELSTLMGSSSRLLDITDLAGRLSRGAMSVTALRACQLPMIPWSGGDAPASILEEPGPWYWLDEVYAEPWGGPSAGLPLGIHGMINPATGLVVRVRVEGGGRVWVVPLAPDKL